MRRYQGGGVICFDLTKGVANVGEHFLGFLVGQWHEPRKIPQGELPGVGGGGGRDGCGVDFGFDGFVIGKLVDWVDGLEDAVFEDEANATTGGQIVLLGIELGAGEIWESATLGWVQVEIGDADEGTGDASGIVAVA